MANKEHLQRLKQGVVEWYLWRRAHPEENLDLSGADLRGVDLSEADLNGVNLSGADLRGVDLRWAHLMWVNLNGATLTDARLYESKRAGWSIQGIICEAAYWDQAARERTTYSPGEFERLYADKTAMARIFLCHASEDKPRVALMYFRLRALGWQPWMDEMNLLPGQQWQKEIPEALKASDFILIFFSRNSVAKRGYVQREFKLALDTLQEIPSGMIHTIPIRLDDCVIPPDFGFLHWGDLFDEAGFDRIVQAIRAGLSQRQR